MQRKTLLLLVLPFLLPVAVAYFQWAMFGLPSVSIPRALGLESPGFPAWLCVTHLTG